MENRKKEYDALIEAYGYDGFYFENVRFEIPAGILKTVKRDFELILLNTKKILFFARIPNDTSKEDAVSFLRAALNCLVGKLSISLYSVVPCGANDNSFFFLNKFNDRLSVFSKTNEEIDCFLEMVENELRYGPEVFTNAALRELSDTLILSSGIKEIFTEKEKVRSSADGTVFIRKHGTWKEASAPNTKMVYMLAALTGALGGHLFYQQRRSKALLYLFTFGIFGIGWLFDSIEILLGTYKDKDGRYLVPLENKWTAFLLLLAGAVVFCLFVFILSLIVNPLIGVFTDLLTF